MLTERDRKALETSLVCSNKKGIFSNLQLYYDKKYYMNGRDINIFIHKYNDCLFSFIIHKDRKIVSMLIVLFENYRNILSTFLFIYMYL